MSVKWSRSETGLWNFGCDKWALTSPFGAVWLCVVLLDICLQLFCFILYLMCLDFAWGAYLLFYPLHSDDRRLSLLSRPKSFHLLSNNDWSYGKCHCLLSFVVWSKVCENNWSLTGRNNLQSAVSKYICKADTELLKNNAVLSFIYMCWIKVYGLNQGSYVTF